MAISPRSSFIERTRAIKALIWDQQATLIDLAGKAPLVSTLSECVAHFAALKSTHQAEARILLTQPTARVGQKTRTWLLEPQEIEGLLAQFRAESH
ncbi:MAG TPA: hypothetical protein VF503_03610 [Sphingobium sp.]|uniref:hypothetical protein n=1 Tax=Sphingobium sp. TaxID=1912891 RepID=UPI002ED652AC